MSSTRVDLPLPETPVTQVKQPSGKRRVDVLQIVFGRADDRQPAGSFRVARGFGAICRLRPAACGIGMRDAAGKIIGRQRILRAQNFLERSLRHDLAAARAGARPEIENVIGRADRFLIVLDHDDGIPEIAQPAQRAEQPRVVALMQADARFVQHVKNAGQPGTDLRRQPDSLRFAAGKRAALAIEREIAEADLDEKLQARLNLANHFGDDRSSAARSGRDCRCNRAAASIVCSLNW